MFSYIIGECMNYACSTPPKYCIYGDFMFAVLLMLMLVSIIYNLLKKDED